MANNTAPSTNNQRRYSPPPKTPAAGGAAAKAATSQAATSARPAAKSFNGGRPSSGASTKSDAKKPADYDIVAMDSEFQVAEKVDKEINGQTVNVSLRLGAIWKGRPRQDGTMGAPFVVLGLDGGERSTAKMYLENEDSEGAEYIVRLTEMGDQGTRVAVKGQGGVLGKVWWPVGGLPHFTFTENGAQYVGGNRFGLAYARGNGKKNG